LKAEFTMSRSSIPILNIRVVVNNYILSLVGTGSAEIKTILFFT